MSSICPCCGSANAVKIARTLPMPVNACTLTSSALLSQASPKRPIDLVGCNDCTFMWNHSFDPDLLRYDISYEGTQIHSPHFRTYLEETARSWLEVLGPQAKTIFEVGCGQGEFLDVLARQSSAQMSGCDPAYRGAADRRVTIQPDVLTEADGHKYDAVINRMTLEHIADPYRFMESMATCVADEGCLITQVPNAARMIENTLYCDLIYEHVNYFNAFALIKMMERVGFQSNHCELSYDNQHLTVFSYRAPGHFDTADTWQKPDMQAFLVASNAFADMWDGQLSNDWHAGRQVFVWGAGSRATTFLNVLPNPDLVTGVIDINPRRNGTFVQGTDRQTRLPQALCGVKGAKIIVMNPIYKAEIQTTLDALGVDAELVVQSL